MKKKIAALKYAFVFALMVLSFPSYAGDLGGFTPYFSITNISIGGLLPITEGSNAFEFRVEVLPIGFEHLDTRLGIWFSPLNFFNVNRAGNENDGVSLINMGIYWNALSFWDDALYLGPFVSASYFFFDNRPHWDRYTFTAGLRGGFVKNIFFTNLPIIFGETGLRIIDGKSNVFLSLKVDVLALLVTGTVSFLTHRSAWR